MPSAKEFKENGYSVGEMDDILLRKIEELTLYTINQEKQNKTLSEAIDKQQKELYIKNAIIQELIKRIEKIENKYLSLDHYK